MSETALPEVKRDATVHVRGEDGLLAVLSKPLDFGCRPQVTRHTDGSASLLVIATAAQIAELRGDGFELTVPEVPPSAVSEVGTGDRFEGGRVIPSGFGVKAAAPPRGSSPGL